MKIKKEQDFLHFIYILVSFLPIIHQNSIRAFEFSKRLVKQNIHPIFITQKINKKSPLDTSLLQELPSSLKIYRTILFESNNRYRFFLFFNIFRFLLFLGMLPFIFSKIKRILKRNPNIKFIYASGPHFYTHIVGYLLKKKSNLPLIVEYRDPWSYNPYNEEKVSWIIKKIDLLIEEKILRSADSIITVSPALNEFLRKRFPFVKNKDIISIPNGFNLKDININLKKNIQEIIFIFTGSLYEKRTIIPLLKIISDLKTERIFQDIRFKLKIFGNYPQDKLEKIIKELQINDLVYLGGFIPRTSALNEVKKSDIAVHIGENINYPTIAFKVWDYLSYRKRILYIGKENSYTANFLRENDFGIILPVENFDNAKKILKNLLIDLKEKNIDTTLTDKKLKNFTWDAKASIFMDKVIKIIKK